MDNYRMERIERLLKDLEREVSIGILEREIDEHLAFRFVVGASREIHGGVVFCEFRTRPVPMGHFSPDDLEPRLRVVK